VEEKTNQSDVEKTKSFGEVLKDSFNKLRETLRAFFKERKVMYEHRNYVVYLWFNCDDQYARACVSKKWMMKGFKTKA
jgi:hypothetical protein